MHCQVKMLRVTSDEKSSDATSTLSTSYLK